MFSFPSGCWLFQGAWKAAVQAAAKPLGHSSEAVAQFSPLPVRLGRTCENCRCPIVSADPMVWLGMNSTPHSIFQEW
jgi:hypothetical protein